MVYNKKYILLYKLIINIFKNMEFVFFLNDHGFSYCFALIIMCLNI